MTHYTLRRGDIPTCQKEFARMAQTHHELQQRILERLDKNQNLIHALDLEGWKQLLSDPRHHVFTANEASSGKLIGQLITLLPDLNNPDADMIDMKLPSSNPLDLATFRTIMSDPNHRGCGIMLSLLLEAFAFAREQGRSSFLGCATRSNTASWSQFLKAGMIITGAGFDPSDKSTVYYAYRHDQQPHRCDPNQSVIIEEQLPLEMLKRLFDDGYIGVAAETDLNERYTGRLILNRRHT